MISQTFVRLLQRLISIYSTLPSQLYSYLEVDISSSP